MQNPYVVAQMCFVGAVLIDRNAPLIVRFFVFLNFGPRHLLSCLPQVVNIQKFPPASAIGIKSSHSIAKSGTLSGQFCQEMPFLPPPKTGDGREKEGILRSPRAFLGEFLAFFRQKSVPLRR